MNINTDYGKLNNYYNKPGFVDKFNISILKKEDCLIDASIIDNKPYIQSCHGHNTQPHTKYHLKFMVGLATT